LWGVAACVLMVIILSYVKRPLAAPASSPQIPRDRSRTPAAADSGRCPRLVPDRASVARMSAAKSGGRHPEDNPGFHFVQSGQPLSLKRPSWCIRQPHAPRDFRALLLLDHCNVILALQIEPELRTVAEVAADPHRRVGRDGATPNEMLVMRPYGTPRSWETRFALSARARNSRRSKRPGW